MRGGRGKKCAVGGPVKPSDSYASFKRGGHSSPYRSQMVEGAQSPKRYDRPGRRFGGRVGADSAPLSQASMISPPAYKKGGRLTAAERNSLSGSTFGLPKQRKYPMPDASHARNALARVSQHGSPEQKQKVKAAVRRKFPAIDVT